MNQISKRLGQICPVLEEIHTKQQDQLQTIIVKQENLSKKIKETEVKIMLSKTTHKYLISILK